MRRGMRLLAAIAAMLSVTVIGAGGAQPTASAADQFTPLPAPQRIADTRASGETIDDRFEKSGVVQAGQRLELDVGGRAGIAADADAAVLNVTVVRAQDNGFVTVYPCDQPQPNGSNINFARDQVIANAVFARLDGSGRTCIFTSATTNFIVDVTGALPGSSFDALDAPARLLDTRASGEVLDDDSRFEKTGRLAAGATFELQVAGRSGVASDATTAVLNVAAVRPNDRGFLTVHPCDRPLPNASNLNYVSGRNVANSVVTRLDGSGKVCIFTAMEVDLIVDVTGTLPGDVFTPLAAPARLYDSRPNGETFDDIAEKTQARRPGTTLELPIAGRAGIPANASAVVLNIVVTQSQSNGFVTVHPRNSERPNGSNLNHAPGELIANAVVAKVGGNGEICMFTSAFTELIVDVAGYFTGPAPVDTGEGCPMEFPVFQSTSFDRADSNHLVGEFQMPPGRYVGGAEQANGFGRCDVFKYEFFGDFFAADDGSRGNFVVFQNGRIVVDVVATDKFVNWRGNSCTPLVPYVAGETPPIDLDDARGIHVVGDHIEPGTYEILTGACWVERMRSLTGIRSLDRISFIDSLFSGGAGTRVTILPTDDAVQLKTECRIRKV